MTGPKRRLSESEAEEEAVAADVEARESGARSFRHWRDRNEPPAKFSTVAMRQACPYAKSDPRVDAFMDGWRAAEGAGAWDHEVCRHGTCERCVIVGRGPRGLVTVRLQGGGQMRTHGKCVHKVSA
jgi:hypothetical protein